MKKLLAIDVGNSNVKYGLFLDGKLSKTWKHPSSETETLARSIIASVKNAPCAMASVVPAAAMHIAEACRGRVLLEVNAGAQSVLSNMDSAMGADRVADAVAAYLLYGKGKATVAMSFGTASTMLALDPGGRVAGGWIAPGLTAQLEVMHERCALLPLLKLDKQSIELGYDTETHMRNGVFVANIGAAREWLETAKRQLGPVVSVATGGWAKSLQKHGRVFDFVDEKLTLKGIELIASETLG